MDETFICGGERSNHTLEGQQTILVELIPVNFGKKLAGFLRSWIYAKFLIQMAGQQRSKNNRSPVKLWLWCLLFVLLFWFVLNNPMWREKTPPPSRVFPVAGGKAPSNEVSPVAPIYTEGEGDGPGISSTPIPEDQSIEISGQVLFKGDIPPPIKPAK